jgi:hypothetical protein
VTFADPVEGHRGGVYIACNFLCGGERKINARGWRHGDKIVSQNAAYRLHGTRDFEKIARLEPDWKPIKSVPKFLFVYGLAMKSSDIIERLKATKRNGHRHAEGGGFRVSVYREQFPPRRCANCRQLFLAARADAKTCSAKCRVALHRKCH